MLSVVCSEIWLPARAVVSMNYYYILSHCSVSKENPQSHSPNQDLETPVPLQVCMGILYATLWQQCCCTLKNPRICGAIKPENSIIAFYI